MFEIGYKQTGRNRRRTGVLIELLLQLKRLY
jgi:hypothetical protein